jgi:DNA-binding response OmpR family regulator
MGPVVFLSDRSPAEALPALQSLSLDVKTEHLSPEALAHLADVGPEVLVVDGEENPEQAYRLLRLVGGSGNPIPAIVLLARAELERFPWAEVADDVVFSGIPSGELRVRLAMVVRRTGGGGDATLRLGALTMNVDTYQVLVAGRVVDLTYKEFELLRFLIQRPGRVFTRTDLLSEVWGYNFYGGTRTVDVHVRRLRAKLGPEYEGLIQTIRGVGYRAAEPREEGTD